MNGVFVAGITAGSDHDVQPEGDPKVQPDSDPSAASEHHVHPESQEIAVCLTHVTFENASIADSPGEAEAEQIHDPTGEPEGEAKMMDMSQDQILRMQAMELKNGELELEQWLQQVKAQDKWKIAELLFKDRESWSEMKHYVNTVYAHQRLKRCSRCRYRSGCDECDHDHALNYILRSQTTPAWFRRAHQKGRLSSVIT